MRQASPAPRNPAQLYPYVQTAKDLPGFLSGNPSANDIFARNFSLYNPVWNTKSGPAIAGAAGTGALINRIYGGPAQQIGLSQLASMLLGGGHIDPALMNQQIAGADRGTQNQQDALRSSLAGGGWDNLGLGKALGAAVGQAGESRVAGIRSNEAAQSYARQQQNLGLLGNLVINPSLQYAGAQNQVNLANTQQNTQNTAGIVGALGAIIGGALA